MFKFTLLFYLTLHSNAYSALEYSKIEYPGCPENAFCQKNSGEVRKLWLDNLDSFLSKKISETKFNQELQNTTGIPIAGWATEEAGVMPKIMLWDSPCQQHKKEASRYYISEFFRKNLREQEIIDLAQLHFPRAYGIENNKVFSLIIPRGDIPTFSEGGNYYFLKDDEHKYYGLLVNRNGSLRVTHTQVVKEAPRDVVCTKEQIDLFNRYAPSTTFYQGYHCKEIWDKSTKTYKSMLFGWSCN